MSDATPVISARNLCKSYPLYNHHLDRLKEALHPLRRKKHQTFHALRDISFDIMKGETVGIIGRNGSGKSTLLKIISGILLPSSGSADVRGSVSALLELGAGFNPEMTGRENVYLNGTLLGFTRKEMREKIPEILNFAEIGEFIDQPVKTYSSGMFVRLAFSVATAMHPSILIIDEALSVGDMFFQAKCMRKMKSLMEEECTTLFVSHDISAVKSLCSRAIYLKNGAIEAAGPAGVVCDLYAEQQISEGGFFTSSDLEEEPKSTDKATISPIAPEKIDAFQKKVSQVRKGSGEAFIQYVGLYDSKGKEILECQYGQAVTVKVVFIARQFLPEVVIAFYVKDKNFLELLGSNNIYEGHPLLNISAGVPISAEFTFTNYFRSGNYSVQVLMADKLDTNSFFDWIDNASFMTSFDAPNRTRWSCYNPPLSFTVNSSTDSEAEMPQLYALNHDR